MTVRPFEAVAIFMPIYPARPEKIPPVKKAKGVYAFPKPKPKCIIISTMNTAPKKMATPLYCLLRKASAARRIIPVIRLISSGPLSLFNSLSAVKSAKARAITAVRVTKNIRSMTFFTS